MDFEPNYGSSEYSREAEELFARFLLDVENGADTDLDALCAENDELADELYGLHADWDNVRGLLARLEGQRAKASPAPPAPEPQVDPEVLAEREARVEPFSAADVPDSDRDALDAGGGTLRAIAIAGVVAALLLGVWSYDLLRTGNVLAKESRSLRVESEAARAELEDVEDRRSALAEREAELRGELQSTLAAKEQLEGESSALALDLSSERKDKRALEEERERLSLELEEERHRKREAAAEVERLALIVEAGELLQREADLWPGAADTAPALERWLEEARAFEQRLAAWSDGPTASGAPRETAELFGTNGRVAIAAHRLERLRACVGGSAAARADAWGPTLAHLEAAEGDSPYRGVELTPQFGLRPLGPDPATGLLRFADLRTGSPAAQPSATTMDNGVVEDALVFVLIPGVELEGRRIEPFLIAEREWSEEARRTLLGSPRSEVAATPIGERARYELDLARFGFLPATSAQVGLARQLGLDAATWKPQPVRPLTAATDSAQR